MVLLLYIVYVGQMLSQVWLGQDLHVGIATYVYQIIRDEVFQRLNASSASITEEITSQKIDLSSSPLQGFLNIKWAKWKRVLLTRSVAMVPCVIIAALAVNSLDYLDEYINVEQSLLVKRAMTHFA